MIPPPYCRELRPRSSAPPAGGAPASHISTQEAITLNKKLELFKQSIINRKIAVVGIGISNMPLIRFLAQNGAIITACDKKPESELGDAVLELKSLDVFTLTQQFGRKIGTYIYNAVRGVDDEAVKEREPRIQFSKIATLKTDSKDYDFLEITLEELCNELHSVVLKNNRMFKSIGIQFVQSDLSNKSKSKMLKNSTLSLEELKKIAKQLLKEALENQTIPIRRLGVKVSELSEIEGQSNITSYF